MIDIGLDFGMTNTTLCYYDPESKALTSFKRQAGDSAYIPTVISYGKKTKIGKAAKNDVGKPETYSNFKLHLGSEFHTAGEGQSRTYGEAAKDYIKQLLEQFEAENGEIGQIVMTIPEAWYREASNLTARENIQSIFQEIGRKNVRFQSEPVAAAAYYCFHQKEKKMQEKLLIVDFGGGTLDVTVCEIQKGRLVRVKDSCGVGEDLGRSGCGGSAFDREVIELLCREQGITCSEKEKRIAIDELERFLIEDEESVSELMNDYYLFPEGMEDEVLFTLNSLGEIDVCCKHLQQAFDKVNRPALEKAIGQMKGQSDLVDPELKIALVGGFSKFCCVEAAVKELLAGDSGAADSRFVSLFSGENRALAVAKGAALISEGQIAVEPVFPYELGMIMGRVDEDFRYHAVDIRLIEKGQKIDAYAQPVYAETAAEVCLTGMDRIFARMYMKNGTERVVFALDETVKDMFPLEDGGNTFHIGLSVDHNMIPVLWTKGERGSTKHYPLNRLLEKILIRKRG